ncbi:hypothetical protein EV361DRAFT_900511 [Lentinula raphanica]|nr:hypothetical protein F5880DRAFT_1176693 [Lentinula raphanica]KAJ3973366.1 hypothetical protein EV361DRAFT_900511 [Lentinula raphanica]
MLFMPSHLIALSCVLTTFLYAAATPLSNTHLLERRTNPSSAPPPGTTAYEVKLYKLKDTLHQVLLIGDYSVHARMPKYGDPGISTSKVDGTKFPPTDRNTKLVPCVVSGEAPKQDLEKRVIEERATVQSLGVLYLESPKVTDETVTKKLVNDTPMENAVSVVGGTCVDWMERVVLKLPEFDKRYEVPQSWYNHIQDEKSAARTHWDKKLGIER